MATSYTWAQGPAGSYAWETAANWSPNSDYPRVAGDSALFSNNIAGTQTITLGTSATVGTLTLADSTSTFYGFTIANSGGAVLTLDDGAGGSPVITVNNAASTISAPLAGTKGFTKAGTQTLNATGSLAGLTGAIAVSAGTVAINNASNYPFSGNITGTGTFSKTGAGTLTLSGATISVSTLTLSAGTTEFAAAGQTVSSPIGGAGAITITAPGTVTFSGGSASSGAWTINNVATLAVNTAAHSNTSGIVTVSSGGTLTSDANGSIAKPITADSGSTVTLSGATTGALVVNTRNFTLTGAQTSTLPATSTIAASNGAVGTLTIGPSRTVTLSGASQIGPGATTGAAAIYQSGAGSALTRAATTTWFFGGANSYSYYLGTNGSLFSSGNNSTVALENGTFDLNGVSVPSGAPSKDLWLGTSTSTTNSTGMTLFRGGVTYNISRFTLGFATTDAVNQYAVVVTGASTVAAVSGASTSQFNGAATSYSTAVVANGGSLSHVGAFVVTGASTKGLHLNGGTYTLTGGTHPAGVPIYLFNTGNKISGGTVATGIIDAVIQTATGYGITSVTPGTAGSGYIGPPNVRVSTINLTAPPVIGASWDGSGVSGYTIHSPGIYSAGSSGPPTLVGGGATSAATAPSFIFGLNSATADGAVEKIDTGTLYLTGANTYSGTTTVSQGKLGIGFGGSAGSIASTTVSVASGATLLLNRNDSPSYSFTITGAGGIEKASGGAGTYTTLTGNNDFTGGVTVTSGDLRAGSSGALGTGNGSVVVSSGATFSLTGGSTIARGVTASGTGLGGGGAIRSISGNNTITGPISCTDIGSDAGTLTISNSDGTSKTFYGNGDIDFSGAVNSSASVVKTSGSGCAILRGTKGYTGDTTVNAGYLGYDTSIPFFGYGSFGYYNPGPPTTGGDIYVAAGAGLRYYGSIAATFGRVIYFTGGAGTHKLESNGTGSTAIAQISFGLSTANTAKTLQLGGTGVGNNTLAAYVLDNGTGKVTVTKADAGKWVLNNTSNGYTGGTNANGGTLVLSVATWASGATVTGTGTVSVGASGKIQTLTGTGVNAQRGRHTYANLTFAANGRIRIGG